MRIELTGIRCRYGSTPAVDGVDLTIEHGEFLALLGPSGSGKTTLLRVLAGLEVPEEGRIRIGGEDALDIPPNKRQVGFVFQNYALFRHMTVARNIAFGLDIRPSRDRPARGVIGARVDELLDLVQLPGYGSRYPQQLSGGQQQRVALARALATEPRILLLDEPFGALDTKVRTELRVWLKALHRRLGVTAVFVTHDQEEALELADRIVVMRAGRIEQAGTPADIYAAPASAFVYDFLGEANRLACRVEAGRALGASGLVLADRVALPDGPAMAWFRPEAVEIAAAGGAGWIEATATDITGIGPHGRIMFEHEGGLLTAKLPAQTLAASGIAIGKPFGWRPREVRIYPAVTP